MKIALVVITYNRIDSLRRLLASLTAAEYPPEEDIPLIISIDKSDSDIVEKFADDYNWIHGTKVVKKQPYNLGLKKHILSQGEELKKYDAIIVLEDDVIVSPAFFGYAYQTVNKYYDNPDIAGISLYSFPINPFTYLPFEPLKDGNDVFFMNVAQSWGQIWLKNQWHDFEKWFEENEVFTPTDEIPSCLFQWTKSWLKYHIRYCAEQNKYFVYPYHSYSTNCGESGVHAKVSYTFFQASMQLKINSKLILPDTPKKGICYDTFFENKALYDALKLNEKNCCLNLNGLRKYKASHRYCLSTLKMPYEIIKTFGLTFHPIEYNVMCKNIGEDIYLYDLKNPYNIGTPDNSTEIINYSYRTSGIIPFIRKYGLKNTVGEILYALKKKFWR